MPAGFYKVIRLEPKKALVSKSGKLMGWTRFCAKKDTPVEVLNSKGLSMYVAYVQPWPSDPIPGIYKSLIKYTVQNLIPDRKAHKLKIYEESRERRLRKKRILKWK